MDTVEHIPFPILTDIHSLQEIFPCAAGAAVFSSCRFSGHPVFLILPGLPPGQRGIFGCKRTHFTLPAEQAQIIFHPHVTAHNTYHTAVLRFQPEYHFSPSPAVHHCRRPERTDLAGKHIPARYFHCHICRREDTAVSESHTDLKQLSPAHRRRREPDFRLQA